jgi:hypothetical protein
MYMYNLKVLERRKILWFVVGLLIVSVLIIIYLDYKELQLADIMLKVIITILTYLIAFVEINDIWLHKKQKRKKFLYILFAILVLLNLWDITNESSDHKIEDAQRNLQIQKDSVRALKIIKNLENSLDQLNKATVKIDQINHALDNTKESIIHQVKEVGNVAIGTSKEVKKEFENLKLDLNDKPITLVIDYRIHYSHFLPSQSQTPTQKNIQKAKEFSNSFSYSLVTNNSREKYTSFDFEEDSIVRKTSLVYDNENWFFYGGAESADNENNVLCKIHIKLRPNRKRFRQIKKDDKILLVKSIKEKNSDNYRFIKNLEENAILENAYLVSWDGVYYTLNLIQEKYGGIDDDYNVRGYQYHFEVAEISNRR